MKVITFYHGVVLNTSDYVVSILFSLEGEIGKAVALEEVCYVNNSTFQFSDNLTKNIKCGTEIYFDAVLDSPDSGFWKVLCAWITQKPQVPYNESDWNTTLAKLYEPKQTSFKNIWLRNESEFILKFGRSLSDVLLKDALSEANCINCFQIILSQFNAKGIPFSINSVEITTSRNDIILSDAENGIRDYFEQTYNSLMEFLYFHYKVFKITPYGGIFPSSNLIKNDHYQKVTLPNLVAAFNSQLIHTLVIDFASTDDQVEVQSSGEHKLVDLVNCENVPIQRSFRCEQKAINFLFPLIKKDVWLIHVLWLDSLLTGKLIEVKNPHKYIESTYGCLKEFILYHPEVFRINTDGKIVPCREEAKETYFQKMLPQKIERYNLKNKGIFVKDNYFIKQGYDEQTKDLVKQNTVQTADTLKSHSLPTSKVLENETSPFKVKKLALEKKLIVFFKSALIEQLKAKSFISIDVNIEDLFSGVKPKCLNYLLNNYESVVKFIQYHNEVFSINTKGRIHPRNNKIEAYINVELPIKIHLHNKSFRPTHNDTSGRRNDTTQDCENDLNHNLECEAIQYFANMFRHHQLNNDTIHSLNSKSLEDFLETATHPIRSYISSQYETLSNFLNKHRSVFFFQHMNIVNLRTESDIQKYLASTYPEIAFQFENTVKTKNCSERFTYVVSSHQEENLIKPTTYSDPIKVEKIPEEDLGSHNQSSNYLENLRMMEGNTYASSDHKDNRSNNDTRDKVDSSKSLVTIRAEKRSGTRNIKDEQKRVLYFFGILHFNKTVYSTNDSSLDTLIAGEKAQKHLKDQPFEEFLKYHSEAFTIDSHGQFKVRSYKEALRYIQVGLPLKIYNQNKRCEGWEDLCNILPVSTFEFGTLPGRKVSFNLRDSSLEKICIRNMTQIFMKYFASNIVWSISNSNFGNLLLETKQNVQQYMPDHYQSLVDFLSFHSEIFEINCNGKVFPPIPLQDRMYIKKKLPVKIDQHNKLCRDGFSKDQEVLKYVKVILKRLQLTNRTSFSLKEEDLEKILSEITGPIKDHILTRYCSLDSFLKFYSSDLFSSISGENKVELGNICENKPISKPSGLDLQNVGSFLGKVMESDSEGLCKEMTHCKKQAMLLSNPLSSTHSVTEMAPCLTRVTSEILDKLGTSYEKSEKVARSDKENQQAEKVNSSSSMITTEANRRSKVIDIKEEQKWAIHFFEALNNHLTDCYINYSSLDKLIFGKKKLARFLQDESVAQFLQYHSEAFQINSSGQVKLRSQERALRYLKIGLPLKIHEHNKGCDGWDGFGYDNPSLFTDECNTFPSKKVTHYLRDPSFEELCILEVKTVILKYFAENTIVSISCSNIENLLWEVKHSAHKYIQERYQSLANFLCYHSEIFEINSCGQIFPPVCSQDKIYVKEKLQIKIDQHNELCRDGFPKDQPVVEYVVSILKELQLNTGTKFSVNKKSLKIILNKISKPAKDHILSLYCSLEIFLKWHGLHTFPEIQKNDKTRLEHLTGISSSPESKLQHVHSCFDEPVKSDPRERLNNRIAQSCVFSKNKTALFSDVLSGTQTNTEVGEIISTSDFRVISNKQADRASELPEELNPQGVAIKEMAVQTISTGPILSLHQFIESI